MNSRKTDSSRLRERQSSLGIESEEVDGENYVYTWEQQDKLRLRQHERELENERKKAEADEEQRRLEFELTKGSSRASGLQAEDLGSVRSRGKLERTAGWADAMAQQYGPSWPLSKCCGRPS